MKKMKLHRKNVTIIEELATDTQSIEKNISAIVAECIEIDRSGRTSNRSTPSFKYMSDKVRKVLSGVIITPDTEIWISKRLSAEKAELLEETFYYRPTMDELRTFNCGGITVVVVENFSQVFYSNLLYHL